MSTIKTIASEFIKMCAKGNAKAAFQLYTAEGFKHHNVYFKGDAASLFTAMDESAKQNPDKVFEIQRALEDGEQVAVHSRVVMGGGNVELALMHIFKFQEDKIIELWDFGQVVTEDIVNENGMF